MGNKLDAKKVIEAMKAVAKEAKKPIVKEAKPYRERDMRQEAMDLGSHGAKEFFGEAS